MNVNIMKNISETDWARFDALTDDEIDTSDIPPLDEDFFAHATLRLPHSQSKITLTLDTDVLEWFETQGQAYQERINLVLRHYMNVYKRKMA